MKRVTFKERLIEALTINRMSQQDLATESGVGKSSISRYIHDGNLPNCEQLYNMAKAMNVNPSWLMGYDVPMRIEILPTSDTPKQDDLIKMVLMLNEQESEMASNVLKAIFPKRFK